MSNEAELLAAVVKLSPAEYDRRIRAISVNIARAQLYRSWDDHVALHHMPMLLLHARLKQQRMNYTAG